MNTSRYRSLSLETSLNRRHRPLTPATFTSNEPNPIFLGKQSVRTLTSLASDIFVNITPNDILELFLLESSLENKSVGCINTAVRSEFRK